MAGILNIKDGNQWTSILSIKGDKGDRGERGERGEKGDAGQGVASGGSIGQILAKRSNTDYDTSWVDPQAELCIITVTGTSTLSADKTYEEITTDYQAGKILVVKNNNDVYVFSKFENNKQIFNKTDRNSSGSAQIIEVTEIEISSSGINKTSAVVENTEILTIDMAYDDVIEKKYIDADASNLYATLNGTGRKAVCVVDNIDSQTEVEHKYICRASSVTENNVTTYTFYLQKFGEDEKASVEVYKALSTGDGYPQYDSSIAPSAMPSGGTTGQVLTKSSNADGAVTWSNIPKEIPSGGSAGQILSKLSGTDYDLIWGDQAKGTLLVTFSNPTGTQSGYIADKTYAEITQAISDGKFVYGYYDGTHFDTNYYLMPSTKTSSSVIFKYMRYSSGSYNNYIQTISFTVSASGVSTSSYSVFGNQNASQKDVIGIKVSYDSTNDEYQYKGVFGETMSTNTYQVLYDKLTTSSNDRPPFAIVDFGDDETVQGDSYDKRGVFPLINTYCDDVYYEDGDYYIPELHMMFCGIGYKNGNPVIMSFDLTGQDQSQIPTNRELVYTETSIGGSSVPSGGTTGQVLMKSSDTDGAVVWSNETYVIPITKSGSSYSTTKTADEILNAQNSGKQLVVSAPPSGTTLSHTETNYFNLTQFHEWTDNTQPKYSLYFIGIIRISGTGSSGSSVSFRGFTIDIRSVSGTNTIYRLVQGGQFNYTVPSNTQTTYYYTHYYDEGQSGEEYWYLSSGYPSGLRIGDLVNFSDLYPVPSTEEWYSYGDSSFLNYGIIVGKQEVVIPQYDENDECYYYNAYYDWYVLRFDNDKQYIHIFRSPQSGWDYTETRERAIVEIGGGGVQNIVATITGSVNSLVSDKTFAELKQAILDGNVVSCTYNSDLYVLNNYPSSGTSQLRFKHISDSFTGALTINYVQIKTITISNSSITYSSRQIADRPDLVLQVFTDSELNKLWLNITPYRYYDYIGRSTDINSGRVGNILVRVNEWNDEPVDTPIKYAYYKEVVENNETITKVYVYVDHLENGRFITHIFSGNAFDYEAECMYEEGTIDPVQQVIDNIPSASGVSF